MSEYIVIWKEAPGQQVTTVIDAKGEPVRRDEDYIKVNKIPVLETDEQVLNLLADATGEKAAVTTRLARRTLGWNV